jgi:hypothetical protein
MNVGSEIRDVSVVHTAGLSILVREYKMKDYLCDNTHRVSCVAITYCGIPPIDN